MIIKDSNLKWAKPLTPYVLNKIDGVAIHHADHPTADINEIHRWHLQNGWSGFGYAYFVTKTGTIIKGREFNYGAHAGGNNYHLIGICFQGDFDGVDKVMSDVQFNAGVQLIKWLKEKIPTIQTVDGHNKWNNTSCPGHYFPLNEMKYLKERSYFKTLRMGSRGVNVQYFQIKLKAYGFLKGNADGIFGFQTLEAVMRFQVVNGLSADGVVGKQTYAAMDIYKAPTYTIIDKGKQVRIIKFRKDSIARVDVIDSNGSVETVKSMHKRLATKPDILINGGLFDTRTGGSLSKFIDEGRTITNGFYSNFSMAVYGASNVQFKEYSIYRESGARDVIGGSPSLVKDGVVNIDTKGLGTSFLNTRHPRLAIGEDSTYFYIVIVHGRRSWLGQVGMTIKELADLCKSLGMTNALNLDGGGSIIALDRYGNTINNPLETRSVDNAIAFYLR